MTNTVSGKIEGNDVSVKIGDITQSNVDAIIVPQLTDYGSYGGVGGSVARNGAEDGMKAYDDFLIEAGEQEFGTVLFTESGGGKSSHLLHVGSDDSDEFNTIKTSTFNALKVAEENGINSIAAPALGTGLVGSLLENNQQKP